MPAKAPLDENVKFLYSCLIRSDYKTIDFSRVAADFAINPAAARMRWSRLKKSINPDDTRPQFAPEPLPKKVKKKAPKTPKEEKEEKEEKSIKEEVKELEFEDAIKDKSTPRKAKLKAGKRIGVVVKNEQDADDDMEGEVSSGDKGDDEETLRAPGNEQPPTAAAAAVVAAVSAPQIKEIFKTEEQDDAEPLQPTPENTQNNTRDLQTTSFLNPPDMFPIPPATFVLPPVTPILDQIAVPEKGEDDDDDGWGATIIVKQETNPDPKTPTKRKFSATLGSTSPASSVSSFSPPSSSHSSPSPSRTPRKSERTPQKWQAIASRSRQPRSKSRKIYSEKNEDEDEDEDEDDYDLAL